RAIIKEKVFAKILFSAPAEETIEARGRIGGDDALPDLELRDAVAGPNNIAGQLVAEQRRRDDHVGVITTPENLYIGTTRECGPYAHKNIFGTDLGYRDTLKLHVLFAVKYGGEHRPAHADNSCGHTITFSGFSPGKSPGCVA